MSSSYNTNLYNKSFLTTFKKILNILGTTDHKVIGHGYIILGFFGSLLGTFLSVLIRIQLSSVNNSFLGYNDNLYNVIITLHGLIMIFYFVMPVLIGGFGNYFVPLSVGAPEMAFPRLNNFSL